MRKFAKSVCLFALLIAGMAPLTGCAGVATTKEENVRMLNRVISYDYKMWNDDWMLATQTHRPLRTSRYVID